MLFVFDTNVLISASLIEGSIPNQALLRAFTLGRLLLSRSTQQELHRVLSRPKFARYLKPEERAEFLLALNLRSHWVEVTTSVQLSRDRKDDQFLELAIDGNASCVVSGDEDLLILHHIIAIPILTPEQFLDQFTKAR